MQHHEWIAQIGNVDIYFAFKMNNVYILNPNVLSFAINFQLMAAMCQSTD
jgi:hypothetical protein